MTHENIQESLAQAKRDEVLIAMRYALVQPLGQGGFGVVWRAHDAHFDREVAIKFIASAEGEDERDASRQWREASLLRRLGLITGARLLDEGVFSGWSYIVMELVDGDPFPGILPDEDEARMEVKCARARALLSELARLHAAGIVHADLKPNNALIERESGRLVLLDFGLSRILGDDLTGKKARREGTPIYMSPEQLRAQRALPASDLYAVGVILFELFAGHTPQDASSVTALMRERLMQPAPSLAEHAPDTPEVFIALVDALLEREPGMRPKSAEHALAIAREDRTAATMRHPVQALLDLDEVLEHLGARESLDLGGIIGADGERIVRAIRARWEARGHTWLEITSESSVPFSALAAALTLDMSSFEGAPLEQVKRAITSAAREAHASNALLVHRADHEIDIWSARLIADVRQEVCVLRTTSGPGEKTIEPIRPAALEALFAGAEAGFRLRSDAAHELYLRTGGQPDAIERELESWRERGIARRSEQRWICNREGLDWLARHGQPLAPSSIKPEPEEFVFRDLLARLAIVRQRISLDELVSLMGRPLWEVEALLEELEARHVIARSRDDITALVRLDRDELSKARAELLIDRLPRDSETRVRVLLEHPGITSVSLLEDTIIVANKLDEDGFSHQALTLLEETAITLRQNNNHEDLARLLTAMTRIALASPSVTQIERLARTLQSANLDELSQLSQLAELARESCRKPGGEVITALDALGQQEDPILELRRRMYMVRAALWSGDDRLSAIIEDADRWANALDDLPEAPATSAGWLGQLAYSSGDYARSAELHAFAARNKRRRSARIASQLGRVWALLDGDRGEEAAEVIHEVAREARACRHHVYELQALQLERWIAYRNGDLPETDDDLLDAIGLMGNIEFEARTFIIEAAVSWRREELETALDYARRGADCWTMSGKTAGATLCQALAMAIESSQGKTIPPTQHRKWCEEAAAIKAPLLAIQSLGLLASVAPIEEPHADLMRASASSLDASERAKRREIISIDEALMMANIELQSVTPSGAM